MAARIKQLSREKKEELDTLLLQLGSNKVMLDLTWKDIAEKLNQQFDVVADDSTYRKLFSKIRRVKESDVETLVELNAEKALIRDEGTIIRRYVREKSRQDYLREIGHIAAQTIAKKSLLPPSQPLVDTGDPQYEGILEISDWHYGIVCNHYWNKFDPEIARNRVRELLDKVKDFCFSYGIEDLHVLNLSDLIAGRIHLTIRLESRGDVISQTIEVAELLAEFIHELSQVVRVHYYDCLDNHSRLEPRKEDSMPEESLTRVITWFLRERLKDNSNVIFSKNKYGADIISFKSMGHEVIGVHGDKDPPKSIVDNLTTFTGEHFDLICTSHLHHFSADEKNDTIVICNGTLMGADNYAKNLRLNSAPSQNLIIVSKDNITHAIHRIVLK